MKVDLEKAFSVNERVEIYVLGENSNAGNYKTLITDFGPDFLEISTPIKNGDFLPLEINTILLLVQIKMDAIYTYQFTIMEVDNNIECFRVGIPEKVKRVQRRSFFRVEFPFKLEVISAVKKLQKNSKRKIEEYLTHDISGGGLSFYTYKKDSLSEFKMEDEYFMKIFINEHVYYFKGRIIRQQSFENQREFIAIQIKEIDKVSREKIIRALFIKQNELLQKGIL